MPYDSRETSNRVIIKQLNTRLRELEDNWKADVLAFASPITYGADDAVRDAIEHRRRIDPAEAPPHTTLAVILETNGGYIEVAERIADTLRHHYQRIDFIVPNYALSAGTVLAMCGDAIHMDYYSVLGPIDPQVQKQANGGGFVPALGYLAQYERLIAKSANGDLTTAELAFLIEKFDPAELYSYEQARDLSITLLKRWLVQYRFKDWTVTETAQQPVDDTMRQARAEEIAKKLNETHRWHSHSRGISMEVLRRNLNIKIDDFGADTTRSDLIRSYYCLPKDYMGRSNQSVIHVYKRYVPLM